MPRAAAVLLLLAACGTREPDAACPHDPAFDRSRLIHVRAEVPAAILRRDLDLPGLALRSKSAAGPDKPQGLTEVEHQLAFRTRMSRITSRERACVWFDEIRADLTPASVLIFVPREYPEGSCEYEAVLAHEREHERIHRERLAAAAQDVEAALTGAKWLPARGNPLEAADNASSQELLEDKVRRVALPVYEKFKEDLNREQALLDKPELYQWVRRRCDGWK